MRPAGRPSRQINSRQQSTRSPCHTLKPALSGAMGRRQHPSASRPTAPCHPPSDAGRSEKILQSDFDSSIRSEEHTSELQSLMRISYAVFCLKKKHLAHNKKTTTNQTQRTI